MATRPRRAQHRSGLPLYVELAHSLRGAIVEGEWAPGERLPAESALAASNQVSVMTMRQALSALQQEGLVVRHQGRGTFVANMRRRAQLRLAIPIDTAAAGSLRVRLLSAERADRPEYILSLLGVASGGTVARVRRVRFAGSQPVSYAVSYIPDWMGVELGRAELEEPLLFDVLEKQEGVRFERADQVVEATVADRDVASILEISVGSPLLLVRRHYFLEGGRMGYVVLNRYPSPLCYVRLRLDRAGAGSGDWRIGPDIDADGYGGQEMLEAVVAR